MDRIFRSFSKYLILAAYCALLTGCNLWDVKTGDPVAPIPMTRAEEFAKKLDPPPEDFGEEFVDPFAVDDPKQVSSESLDPIEPVNREVFWFNKQVYFYLLKPLSTGYRAVLPLPTRQGVKNVFLNVTTPVRAANLLLQLRFTDFINENMRFIANTLLGFGGFIDVAKDYGDLPYYDEDLGQTLGHYGAGPGFYLVLPLFGPSTARDTTGKVGDIFLDPTSYLKVGLVGSAAIYGADSLNNISLDDDSFEAILNQSVDPYSTIRNGYLQHRAAKIEN